MCVQEKLVRYAAVDALEEREAVVATKEKAVGNVIEYEAVAKALKEEYEAKVSTTACTRSFLSLGCVAHHTDALLCCCR